MNLLVLVLQPCIPQNQFVLIFRRLMLLKGKLLFLFYTLVNRRFIAVSKCVHTYSPLNFIGTAETQTII